MESIVIGLPDLAIEAVLSKSPLVFQVRWTGIPQCPRCEHKHVRIKDTFWREIRSIPLQGKPSILKVLCHKYICKACNCYFNTRLSGVKRWSRTTEPLKKTVFRLYNRGYSCKDIALEANIGVASAERYYHQIIKHNNGHLQNRLCPRVLGIDEHRFTRKVGFLTTFCDLRTRRVFDVAKGKSASELEAFLSNLQGRERVKVVCIDLNSAYRSLIRKWFPKAHIVADRFHVIRLVNHHFSQVCKDIDKDGLAYGRGKLMRLLLMKQDRLKAEQQERLAQYFKERPALRILYDFLHECTELLRTKRQTARGCRKYVHDFIDKIRQLRETPFPPLKTLGNTLETWKEEIARMFRYVRNNGITEGFHRKMKLIQRRAYGFRNFENYRLRVRVLCG